MCGVAAASRNPAPRIGAPAASALQPCQSQLYKYSIDFGRLTLVFPPSPLLLGEKPFCLFLRSYCVRRS